ncbi:hypothetical protein LTR10_017722 [Elasticomyces elasticus]|uniref:FAD-binding domain-containing protein n=1 Tax=Exophiala sideris TaxID=1016849 RepID=A0ABR0JBF5_9EURO|nr:hypothetical protein LTR10_017722 [Elasticomyces elasticus]KAK5031029.1 hypothetical protein LTS07_004764 [Exophiala sideris]KAK5038751.1 hypothetical protein LTR13_003782 [Exophiala sideris]KAK5060634.1 hypothetical protein LTR69_005233 [Exophiala sideris]KAK5183547.1 hypothetical protein LTR44_003829 [Eurotiomycetes sp. CCFEE 6388]
MSQSQIQRVIVVGAGPVGLLTALMLGQRGIRVDVLEANDQVNNSPLGLAYGPAAVRVLHRAGILDRTIKEGFIAGSVGWRKTDGTLILGLDRLDVGREGLPHTVILPVGTLSGVLVQEVQKYPSITIHWKHRVTGVDQDSGKARVQLEGDSSTATTLMEADFVIGCDGGTSAVRKALFGGSFPGYTWPMQLIAVNVSIDFDKLDFCDAQWVVDPEHWFVIARIDKAGLWRIVYGETPGLSIDEIRTRLTEKFRKHLPGNPEPEEYTLRNITPYSVHQRCAQKMRVGRILLAGDAAHLNNPMGGLGLTTGVADVGSLIDCLYGIHTGVTSLSILDKYDEKRRQIFLDITDVMSTANFKRIMQGAEGVAERDPILQLLAKAQTDPNVAAALSKASRLPR